MASWAIPELWRKQSRAETQTKKREAGGRSRRGRHAAAFLTVHSNTTRVGAPERTKVSNPERATRWLGTSTHPPSPALEPASGIPGCAVWPSFRTPIPG
jgi:hypothetical protein